MWDDDDAAVHDPQASSISSQLPDRGLVAVADGRRATFCSFEYSSLFALLFSVFAQSWPAQFCQAHTDW